MDFSSSTLNDFPYKVNGGQVGNSIDVNSDRIKKKEGCPFIWQGFGVGRMMLVGYHGYNIKS